MSNINKNIIMQAGAAVANATNKAAGLTAATPEPGTIISAIQLVNGGRKIGPDALAHFTESVRNKLLSLLVSMELIQTGTGTPSPDNVRPLIGRTGLTIYVSPTPDAADATTYAVDWTTQAGTVYQGTVDVVTGELKFDKAGVDLGSLSWTKYGSTVNYDRYISSGLDSLAKNSSSVVCSIYKARVGNETITPNMIWIASGNSKLSATTNVGAYANAAGFKSGMSGQILVYELSTPITYQITGTDIVTLVGDNYIWSDSGDVTITE